MNAIASSQIMQRIEQGKNTRILAFGSSNTERYMPGTHWFDALDLAIRETHCQNQRRMYHCINAGIGGHTTRDLLDRFDRDAAFYKPHLTIITIGGNDANPDKGISPQNYIDNLHKLYTQFTDLGSAVVFQTYYSVIPEMDTPDKIERFERFHDSMDVVRNVAKETGAELIDHLKRWEPLRLKHPNLHIGLMRDAYHVNDLGNKVMGLYVARSFGLRLGELVPEPWTNAKICDALMDELSPNG